MMTQNTWSRILLVNDDPGTLATFKTALDDAGHDVVGCPTVTEAMTYALREPFAVAVMGSLLRENMLKSSGIGLAKRRSLFHQGCVLPGTIPMNTNVH